jgi:predicted peptidase
VTRFPANKFVGLAAGLAFCIGAHALSNNADLEVLQVRATGGTAALSPAFARDRTDYEVKVNSDITGLQVRAGAWVSASKVTMNAEASPYLSWYRATLKPGANKVVVEVASADGRVKKDYTITVQREDIQPVADAFLKFTLNDSRTGLSMPYRLFVPAHYDAAKKYPLVMFLHGGGENGTDNEMQLHNTEGATIWAKPTEQAKHPAFVLAPQSRPFGGSEPNRPLGGFGITRSAEGERYMGEVLKPSADVQMAVKVLEKVLSEYPGVDRKRIYVTGLSQGGFGTWNIALLRPDLFAAAVPIAGGGDPALMDRLVNMPVWAFHAEEDPVIPVSYSRDSVATLRSLGGRPLYTEYPAGAMFDPYEHFSWVYAYGNEGMREWLFRQARP